MKAREEIRSNDVDDVERVRFGHAILRRLRRIFNLPLFLSKISENSCMVGSEVFLGCFGFYRVSFRSQISKNARLGSGCHDMGTAALGYPEQAQKSGQNAAKSGQTSAAALVLGAATLWCIARTDF